MAGSGGAAPTTRPAARARAQRRRVVDRVATLVVRAGGLGIIASILAILVFIIAQVMPLLSAATVETGAIIPLPGADVRALVADEYGSHVAALDLSGHVRIVRLSDQKLAAEGSILRAEAMGAALTAAAVPSGSTLLTGATTAGDVVGARIAWNTSYGSEGRVSTPELSPALAVSIDPAKRPLSAYAVGTRGDGEQHVAAQLADGTVVLVRLQVKEN